MSFTRDWPTASFPVSQVTPFTYRDGATYLEILNELRRYINETLHPSLTKVFDDMHDELVEAFQGMSDTYVEGIAEFQRIHDAYMADVEATLMALNDASVSSLVLSESALSNALKTVFTTTDNTGSFASQFGAVGDGVNDDTDSLEAFLNAGGGNLGDHVYRVTRPIVVERDDVTVNGFNSVILIDFAGLALRFNGDNHTINNVRFDGNFMSSGALFFSGSRNRVISCEFHDFHHDYQARGVQFNGYGGNVVNNCKFTNFFATGDEIRGNGDGMARAVAVETQDKVAEEWTVISNNVFEKIWGEEGDSVIVHHSLDGEYVSAKTVIENNNFNGASRRFVKVQAHDVVVKNNVIRDSYAMTPTGGYWNEAIYSRRGKNIVISGNDIHVTNKDKTAIYVTGLEGDHADNVEVSNNVVTFSGRGVFGNYVDNIKVVNNTINVTVNGRAVSVGNSNGIVSNNTVKTVNDGDGNSIGVYSFNGVVSNNTDLTNPPREAPIIDSSNRGALKGGNTHLDTIPPVVKSQSTRVRYDGTTWSFTNSFFRFGRWENSILWVAHDAMESTSVTVSPDTPNTTLVIPVIAAITPTQVAIEFYTPSGNKMTGQQDTMRFHLVRTNDN